MKKKVYSELLYALGLPVLSFAVAMVAAADFGVSMIVAPAYILSLRFDFLTFGQGEYIVQGVLFVLFCILMRRVRAVYFSSFLTGLIYGALLDLWQALIPVFNPEITVPGSMALPLRILFFTAGTVLTSVSVAMLYRTYFYPQVYDFFVKGISGRYRLNRNKFKYLFDFSCLLISCAMALLLLHSFRGVGIGTLVMTVVNGPLIGLFGKWMDKRLEIVPAAKKLSGFFELE